MGRVRTALASLTAGQRWTASLALALGVTILLFGMPGSAAPLTANAALAAPGPTAVAGQAQNLPPADLSVAIPDLAVDLAPPAFDYTPLPPDDEVLTPAPADPSPPPPPPVNSPGPLCVAPHRFVLTGVPQIDAVLCALFPLIPVALP